MRLELRQDLIDRLAALPESGMGYQLVDLVLVDGRVVPNVIVFNCEIADLPEAFGDLTASQVVDVHLVPLTPSRRNR